MEISKTNQILVNRIRKTVVQHVKNPKALRTFEKHLLSIQGSNKKLKELFEIVKSNTSTENNTLSKIQKTDRKNKQITTITTANQEELKTFNSFQSPEQTAAIYDSLRLLPKSAKVKNIGAEYKKKHIVAIAVKQPITREKLQKLGDKISANFAKHGVTGSIGIAIKYREAWRASQFVNFGQTIRLHTNQDSDQAFDEDDIQSYEIYYSEAPNTQVGASPTNDCLYDCLYKILGDDLPFTAEQLKLKLKVPRFHKIPLEKLGLVEKMLKNVAINVEGDYTFNSGIITNKRIYLEVSNEHVTLAKIMTKPNKLVSFRERKPIIYDRVTFMAYDGKNQYKMKLDDLCRHYNWETDYIVINYEPSVVVNKEKIRQTLEQAYDQFIKDADKLKEMTNGTINLYKTGNDKTTALHLFETLTKHIEAPPKLHQNEADEIQKASMGAIIFNTKEYVGDYYKYDIKSAYPSIMKGRTLFPCKEGEFMHVTQEEFSAFKSTFFKYGIYRCNIPYNVKFKKLFRFNDSNRYTHIDLTRAVELGIDIELIVDDQANFLHYSRDKLLAGSEIFGRYIDYCFDLKEKNAPKSKMILNKLWGSLSQKKVKKHINDNKTAFVISDNAMLHGIKPFNDTKTIFEVSKMSSQYRSGWARICPFLLAKGRTTISKLIEPYQDICIRTHTDSMNLMVQPDDIVLGSKIGDLCYEGKFTTV